MTTDTTTEGTAQLSFEPGKVSGADSAESLTKTILDAAASSSKGSGEATQADGADTGITSDAAAEELKKLEQERDEKLKKINDAFDAKAFKLRQKAVSLSERKSIAHELVERLRGEVRTRINQPYAEDAAVDGWIEKAFTAGMDSITN